MAYGLFLDQGSNHFPCIARQILNPREAQDLGLSWVNLTQDHPVKAILTHQDKNTHKLLLLSHA